MANPRIEEVDDASDPDEMDLDAFDFAKPAQGGLQSAMDPSQTQISPEVLQQMLGQQIAPDPSQTGRGPQMSDKEREGFQAEQKEKTKQYQCIYPVYFDSTRSREDGRRVRKENAVPNPLARDIVDALQHIGNTQSIPFQIAFEPAKTHPRDWANPGRIRVLVKRDGKPISARCQNKYHLYAMISEYLKTHPATHQSALRFRPQGMPMSRETTTTPAVPRGFKIGTILPLHSPALSGGGVSDNFMKDMMSEMGGQLPPGMEGLANMANAGGSGGGPKKPKVIRAKR